MTKENLIEFQLEIHIADSTKSEFYIPARYLLSEVREVEVISASLVCMGGKGIELECLSQELQKLNREKK